MQYRLKEARQFANLSQAKIAIMLNTTQQQIAKYETERQEIPLYRAIMIADICGVSLDWIAGRTNKKEVNR